MKIACVILGTRGDVQPMVALADGLSKKGHEVTICAPPENEELVYRAQCRFIQFGPGIKKAVSENPEKQKGGVAVKISPRQGKQLTSEQINLLPEKIRGAELVLGAGIVLGVHTAADILKVPYRFVGYYPIILGTTVEDPLKNRMMFRFGRSAVNLVLRGFINRQRLKFSLPPVKDVWSHWMGENVIIACDRELNPAREGVSFRFTQTGFMLLPSKTRLPGNVEDFCSRGIPPVYIGFGSNPIASPGKYSGLFKQIQKTTGRRLVISRGWAGLNGDDSEDIIFVDEMPFDLLFPKMAAAIFHGGTGTMAAIARAGIPQAAFPFMGDQFDNRKQIVRLGLGPETCDFKNITADAISAAIKECVTNEKYLTNAVEMSERLRKTDGVEMTIGLIEKEFS
jgi:vancomycin aglycone glucosyltransferase